MEVTKGCSTSQAEEQPSGVNVEMKTLEASIMKLAIAKNDNSDKAEFVSKLEIARINSAEEKRLVRKIAWTKETRKEVMKVAEFRATSELSELVPDLVWKRILEQVEGSKEKMMLSNMSMVWRDALKLQRTTFLFHEVFPLVHYSGYLSSDDILNCRVVCREWKKSIENSLQNTVVFEASSMLQLYDVKSNVWAKVDNMSMKFRVDGLAVARFLENSRSVYPSNGNPFFSRTIRLGCICPHDTPSHHLFWAQVGRLLGYWGREIWTLHIQFSRINPFDSAGIYRLVCGLLRLLPNLRCLTITCVFPLDMEDMTSLKTGIKEAPLPELLHLNYIVCTFLPPLMLKTMLNKFAPTLKKFCAQGIECSQNVYGNTRLPVLQMFSLGSTLSSWAEESKYKFTVDWPSIEELDLYYRNIEAIGIPKLFHSLNQFGRGLLKLHLKLQKEGGPASKLDAALAKKLFLELPKLEYFSLAMARANLKSIDFILPMISLKELSVCYVKTIEMPLKETSKKGKGSKAKAPAQPFSSTKQKSESADNDSDSEIIKFWNYTNRLYESNIWRLLPELRKVTITIVNKMIAPTKLNETIVYEDGNDNVREKIYTRSGYNQLDQ